MSMQVLWPFVTWVICLFIFVFYTTLIFNHEVELFSNEILTAVFVYTFSLIQVIISRINSDLISLINSTQCAMFLHNKKLARFEKQKMK